MIKVTRFNNKNYVFIIKKPVRKSVNRKQSLMRTPYYLVSSFRVITYNLSRIKILNNGYLL